MTDGVPEGVRPPIPPDAHRTENKDQTPSPKTGWLKQSLSRLGLLDRLKGKPPEQTLHSLAQGVGEVQSPSSETQQTNSRTEDLQTTTDREIGVGIPDNPLHTETDETSFDEDIRQYEVPSIAGMHTYEGTVTIPHVRSDGTRELIPIKARVMYGSDVDLPKKYNGEYPNGDPFSSLFYAATSRLIDTQAGWYDASPSTHPNVVGYKTIVDRYNQAPDLPINVIYAHGFNNNGHTLQTFEDPAHPLDAVIGAVKGIKLQPGDRDTFILASCNGSRATIEHPHATIIYNTDLVGYLQGGRLTVSRPSEPPIQASTYDELLAAQRNPTSNSKNS